MALMCVSYFWLGVAESLDWLGIFHSHAVFHLAGLDFLMACHSYGSWTFYIVVGFSQSEHSKSNWQRASCE